jgi:4-carboxymuconolactone decarboxylase
MHIHTRIVIVAVVVAAGLVAQQSRFPELKLDDTSGEQRAVAERMLKETRVGLGGPWNILLRSPTVAQGVVDLYHYFRWNSSLPTRLIELGILITSKEAQAPYEWYVHYPLGIQAGLSATTLADVKAGRRPAQAQPDERAVYDFTTELLRARVVSDATFKKAKAALTEKGTVDLTALAGTYQAIGGLLNVSQTWGKPGEGPEYLPIPSGRP